MFADNSSLSKFHIMTMDFYNFILITGHRLEEKNVCNLPLSNPQVVLYSSVLLAEIFAIYSAVLIFAKALKLKQKKNSQLSLVLSFAI